MGAVKGGSEGFYFNDGDPKEFVSRPSGLDGVANAFALYVDGDSMEPTSTSSSSAKLSSASAPAISPSKRSCHPSTARDTCPLALPSARPQEHTPEPPSLMRHT